MILNYEAIPKIFIICGRTDMRRGINGLASIIATTYELDPYESALFLFCGGKKDRYKGLIWEKDGFLLLTKRLESEKLQWPRTQDDVKELSQQELNWLLDGLSIVQPKAIKPAKRGYIS